MTDIAKTYAQLSTCATQTFDQIWQQAEGFECFTEQQASSIMERRVHVEQAFALSEFICRVAQQYSKDFFTELLSLSIDDDSSSFQSDKLSDELHLQLQGCQNETELLHILRKFRHP